MCHHSWAVFQMPGIPSALEMSPKDCPQKTYTREPVPPTPQHTHSRGHNCHHCHSREVFTELGKQASQWHVGKRVDCLTWWHFQKGKQDHSLKYKHWNQTASVLAILFYHKAFFFFSFSFLVPLYILGLEESMVVSKNIESTAPEEKKKCLEQWMVPAGWAEERTKPLLGRVRRDQKKLTDSKNNNCNTYIYGLLILKLYMEIYVYIHIYIIIYVYV